MQQQELIPHLFRTEYSKITAVLCKHFGLDQLEIAEDLASEAFLAALSSWPYHGVPENPTAWLYAVAKNKTKNYLARNKSFETIAAALQHQSTSHEIIPDLSEKNISDSQLQMMFAICHPALSSESQVGLALRILCGFGIDEIAVAFLSNRESINKRLVRAREKLRSENIKLVLPDDTQIPVRLDNVLTTLYLLFSEGYYSESHDTIIRDDLCLEAMRLTHLLIDNPKTDLPKVNALLALMCFHASRLEARKDGNGAMILYHEQNETLWNRALIARGAMHLHKASQGEELSKYHLEASIAYWHTIKEDALEKWENILQLYNKLLTIEYSPIAALNRTYALSKVKGKTVALLEATKLNLKENVFYHVLLGDLSEASDPSASLEHFEKAFARTKSRSDQAIILKRIERIRNQPG